MYKIYVLFKCVPDKREAYVEALKAEGLVDAVRKEEGCIRYDYYFSEKDPDEIILIEVWESQKHQEIHLKQPHMQRMFELKPDFVLSSQLGEFELK